MRGLNPSYFPQRGFWRGGRSRRHRYGFPQKFSRRGKGQKIVSILLLMLLLAIGFFLWEVVRTYRGENAWYEDVQPPSDDDDK